MCSNEFKYSMCSVAKVEETEAVYPFKCLLTGNYILTHQKCENRKKKAPVPLRTFPQYLITVILSFYSYQFKCCGANDYTDFTGATQWTFNYTGTVCNCVLDTPLSCCKTLPSGSTATDFSCSTTPTDTNNYLNTV